MKKMRSQYGFTLLEQALVLVVIGIIISGVWFALAGLQENTRQEKFIDQTIAIIANARRVLGNSRATLNINDANEMTTAAMRSGIFPVEMIGDGVAQPVNAYGGNTVLRHDTSPDVPQLVLSLGNVTQEGCVNLLSKIIRDPVVRRQYGIMRLGLSNDVAGSPTLTGTGTGDIATRTIVQTYCTSGAANNAFALHIGFRYF